jgi:hypothetical protein
MKLKPWSRAAAIVLAILHMIAVPIGTIAGIVIVMYFNRNKEAKQAFGLTS